MSLSEIETTEQRLAASELALTLRVSTANFEDADIDYYYRRSDQREFVTRCRCPGGVILTRLRLRIRPTSCSVGLASVRAV